MIDQLNTRILDFLRERGIAETSLVEAEKGLREGTKAPVEVARELCRKQQLSESDYQALLAEVVGFPIRDTISVEEVDPGFTRRIPIAFVRRHRLIGLMPRDGVMPIVTDDPADPTVIDCVAAILKTPVIVELASTEVVRRAINEAYAEQESDFDEVLEGVDASGAVGEVESLEEGDLLDTASRAPVVKLVNMILFEAVKRRASDVHIHPLGSHVQVRYRIDGVLYDYLELPAHLLDEVTSRIKVIGQMDIAEKRLAQDGRTTVAVGDKSIDLRISIIPTSHGERAVLRLLDKSARLYELPELGMAVEDQRTFASLIQRTHGIILVTGPTGSGKSTTLYAALQYLDCKEKNILTLEDPIEYQLPGISQTQVSTKKGMTFATGLRAVLRQDPDIIMVGEIRDEETARMAIQSSLTGHLVFSTLHTNNAAGAISRLLDLGIEPYLVASSLLTSLAQRLVRVVCPHCCEAVSLSTGDVRAAHLDASMVGQPVKIARGCERCGMTGYCGRRGIFELLSVDESIRELIVTRAKTSGIEARAMANGMTTLRQDALRKLLAGETTVEEVSRVTHQDVSAEQDAHSTDEDREGTEVRSAECSRALEECVSRVEQAL